MNEVKDNKEILKELTDFYNEMEKNRIERVGYIFLPSIEGFKVFEIAEDHLKKFLTLESQLNRFNKSVNDNEESS
jgi:hypothetical protein